MLDLQKRLNKSEQQTKLESGLERVAALVPP